MYYLIFSIASFFVFCDFSRSLFCKVVVFLVFWCVLSLFAGLRGEGTASDYLNYIAIYDSVPVIAESFSLDSFVQARTEVAYYFLNSLVKTLTSDYLYLFLLMAMIAVGLNLLAYSRFSPFFVLSILIYFSHVYLYREFMQIRAGVACSILLFSIPYLWQRNFRIFASVVLIAAAFHVAALIFFLAYLFYKHDIRTKTYFQVLFFSVVFSLVVDIKVILSFFNSLGVLPRPLYLYLVWDKYNYSLGVFNPVTMKQFFLCLILLYARKNIYGKVKYFDAMLFLYVFSTCWLLVFNGVAILAGRVATFFSIVDPILMVSVVYAFRQRLVAYIGVYLFCVSMLVLNIEVKSVVNDYRSVLGMLEVQK